MTRGQSAVAKSRQLPRWQRRMPAICFMLVITSTVATVSLAFTQNAAQQLQQQQHRIGSSTNEDSRRRRQLYRRRQKYDIRSPLSVVRMAVDPDAVVQGANAIMSGINHHADLQQHLHHQLSVSGQQPDVAENLRGILSTMYTASADAFKPAHGHSQPLWGPPDPYLKEIKSIAPIAETAKLQQQALATMGQGAADGGASAATTAAPSLTAKDLPDLVRDAMEHGVPVMNSKNLHQEPILPGFKPTGGILPTPDQRLQAIQNNPDGFVQQVRWAEKFLNVFDKLPYVAFTYGLIEFFILRPGIDLYKEDIEDFPEDVLAETIVTTGVRLVVFCVAAIVTLGMFG